VHCEWHCHFHKQRGSFLSQFSFDFFFWGRDADEAEHTLKGCQLAVTKAAACLTAKTQDAQATRDDLSGSVEQLVSAHFWLYSTDCTLALAVNTVLYCTASQWDLECVLPNSVGT